MLDDAGYKGENQNAFVNLQILAAPRTEIFATTYYNRGLGSVRNFNYDSTNIVPIQAAGLNFPLMSSSFAGFSNLDKFAWIGSYSAYLTPEVFNKYFTSLAEKPEATNQQLKLLWLGVGREDFLYRQAVTFDEFLKEKKIEHKSLVTDGGHTWMNARLYLTETLQLYFK